MKYQKACTVVRQHAQALQELETCRHVREDLEDCVEDLEAMPSAAREVVEDLEQELKTLDEERQKLLLQIEAAKEACSQSHPDLDLKKEHLEGARIDERRAQQKLEHWARDLEKAKAKLLEMAPRLLAEDAAKEQVAEELRKRLESGEVAISKGSTIEEEAEKLVKSARRNT